MKFPQAMSIRPPLYRHLRSFTKRQGHRLSNRPSLLPNGSPTSLPGGTVLVWAYQILAVALLAAASMTAFQDVQATEWRDAAIGEIPDIIVHRDPHGTFTRSVTITFAVAVLLMFLVRGQTTQAIPYYGIGVFMPIMVMGRPGRPPAHQATCGRRSACLGHVWRKCGGGAGSAGIRGPDRRQMGGGLLGGPDLVQRSGAGRAPGTTFAVWASHARPDRNHRAA